MAGSQIWYRWSKNVSLTPAAGQEELKKINACDWGVHWFAVVFNRESKSPNIRQDLGR